MKKKKGELSIYINGTLLPKKEAKVSVFDHGFLYGDGVFEGIRSYNGLIFKSQEHVDRLFESAKAIMLSIPLTKKEMQKAMIETLKANKLKDAYIRLIVSRGEGDLGLDPRKCKKASVIIITDTIKLYPESLYKNGLDLITVPTPRNKPEALNPKIKSMNYMNNILAKIEAINSKCEEAVMLSWNGYVAECTGDNIFMVKNGVLITPPPYLGVLEGITRKMILDMASKEKITAKEDVFTRFDLYNADEVFLTGTAAEVIPVVKVDGRQVGDGKPGTVTHKLTKRFRQQTKVDGVKYKL